MAEDVVGKIKEKFSGKTIIKVDKKSDRRIYVHINPADVVEVVNYVFHGLKARFSIATGMDTPGGIEILYHFAFDKLDKFVTICVMLDRDNPEIDSACIGIKAIEWIEREIAELLGVKFRNHPDPRHLLLKDDWPRDNYPLRRK